MKEFGGLTELFCVLFVGVATQTYICIKTQSCTQKVNFLYVNKNNNDEVFHNEAADTYPLSPLLCPSNMNVNLNYDNMDGENTWKSATY